MNTRHHIASFGFALLAPASPAQDGSFLPEGIEATGDTAEVRALTDWANEHRHRDPEQAQLAAERALALARELGDQRGMGENTLLLGRLASDLDEQEAYFTEAYDVFEQIGDERSALRSLVSMGVVYKSRGQLNQALTAYFDALEGLERLGDTEGQAGVLTNIGIVYRQQGSPAQARPYHERAVELAETLDEPILLAKSLNNLATLLMEQGAYEAAEGYLRRALAIAEQENAPPNMAVVSNNLGYVFTAQGLHDRALPHLRMAERLGRELGDQDILSSVYDELAKAHLGLGEIDRALHYAHEGLAPAQTLGPREVMFAHQTLSRIYEAAGNTDKAFDHYRQYAAARDSAFTAERAEIITEMQTRYETEERQRDIERLEQENQIQALRANRRQTVLLAGILVALLIAGLFYYRYRAKRKAGRLLEELDAAKSRFFANISHEFRTPLTVILGGLQDALAGRFDGSKKKLTEQRRAMLRNTRQLQRLIDEVLDLNRLEAGKLELNLVPGDLVRSLRRIIEADAPLAERNGVTLTFEPDVETCPRLYDEEKLQKIVGNLLSNALKFTPKDGSVQVELHSNSPVAIVVSDTGPGIPVDEQEKIFERFAQVEDGSHHGGTGIGLALAKELAELHGGTITLESEPGKGSTFTVRLPLPACRVTDLRQEEKGGTVSERVPSPFKGEEQGEGTPAEESAVDGDGHEKRQDVVVPPNDDVVVPPNGGMVAQQTEESDDHSDLSRRSEAEPDQTTVLIIEDNADVRAYVRRSLDETYRVLEAADGEAGLQKARSELPDLIVSDVMLPGIDGYEVAKRLKAEADTECIPVVMLTARAAEEDQTEGYGSGAEVYITKPFAPETLRAALARLLEERHRLRRHLQEAGNRTEGTEHENGEPTLADRARAAVLEHLHDEDFGVEELASALNMTRFTLYNRFKPELNLTPSDFVRNLRLERARELLSGGAGSVSEVAYAVGFNSLSIFSRAYRTHYGVPPSEHLGKSPETLKEHTG